MRSSPLADQIPTSTQKGYQDELTIQETAFNNELKRQEAEGPPTRGGRGGRRGQ